MHATTETKRVFEFINRRVARLVVLSAVAAVLLAVVGVAKIATTDNPEDADFNPSGAIFDAAKRAEDAFDVREPVLGAQFIVESADGVGGDVLTRDGLGEFLENATSLTADADSASHLTAAFDNQMNLEIDGIYSIAHAVDDAIPGGLESATDADVKLALASVLDPEASTAGLRSTLSQRATSEPGTIGSSETTVWRSPAFVAEVRFARDSFAIDHPDSDDEDLVDYEITVESERWLRDAQDILQGDEQQITVLGFAIDGTLTDEEESVSAAPFILLAIVLIVFLVGALLRSYWAAAITVAGLGFTFLAYLGLWNLAGVAKSLFVTLVVPITVISFGVDYFVHAIGRCREEQRAGAAPDRVYPVGMSLVAGAILLALLTTVLAFLSNIASGIPAIAEFGIAASMGLVVSYLLLGNLGPKLVLAIENRVGPQPRRGHLHLGTRLGFLAMTLVGGAVVMMCVLQPPLGAIGLFVFIPLFVVLPLRFTRRRNERAAAEGVTPDQRVATGGRGVLAAGSFVHFMARWRIVTLPLALLTAVAGVWGATKVDGEFEVADFVSSRTDLVKSFELREDHFASSTGGEAYLLIEGALTAPQSLVAIEQAAAQLDSEEAAASQTYFTRDFDGELVTPPNLATVVRMSVASPTSVAAIEEASGIEISLDANGLPTASEQVAAVLTVALDDGVADSDGRTILRPDEVARIVSLEDPQTTAIRVEVPTITDESVVKAARDALEGAGDDLEQATEDAVTTIASGEAITTRRRLDAITNSMLLAIPLSFVMCAVVAMFFMRSVRYALISVVPMLIVVAWLYGFMALFDYSINPVTATVAAIAIGVGVDSAMHFTIRFREEFVTEPSRFPALRRAGEATGVALAVSAFTSVGGFAIMALTPMPVFAGFGVLMAVTIIFSLVVALLVLPSLLLLVTPSRKGDTRRFLEESLTGGGDYDPHSPATAHRAFANHEAASSNATGP